MSSPNIFFYNIHLDDLMCQLIPNKFDITKKHTINDVINKIK